MNLGVDCLTKGRLVQFKVYGNAIVGLPRCFYKISTLTQEPEDSNHLSPVLVSTLTDNLHQFETQAELGKEYVDGLFSTFMIHDDAQTDFNAVIDFLDENYNLIGQAIVKQELLVGSEGDLTINITNLDIAIGTIGIEYLILHPFANTRQSAIETNDAKVWHEIHKTKLYHIGHRGLGVGRREDSHILENTIKSFNGAADCGADMIELDVSVTKDGQVIVYHDLELVDEMDIIFPIQDLTSDELHSYNFHPVNKDVLSAERRRLTFDKNETDPFNLPFQTLSEVLRNVRPQCGINVEIKFPHRVVDGTWIPHPPMDLNYYCDQILDQVFKSAGDREIVFTSFHPDVCSAIRVKQTKYAVIFLTRGSREVIPHIKDLRMAIVEMAAFFAESMNLAGINSFSEDMIVDRTLVSAVRSRGLLVWIWDGKLSTEDIARLIDYGVHAIIYDNIDEKIGFFRNTSSTQLIDSSESVEILPSL